MTPRFDAGRIREYYERHTPAFIAYGQGGRAGAIHRAVWGPGTTTRADAFHYVEDRIAGLAGPDLLGAGAHVVDLGCGVGASLCHLASRFPIRATGITISALQAQLATRRIANARLSGRVRCIEGDYCDLPPAAGPADLAYAIESFAHTPSPERFFAQCRTLVRANGLLVICDDMRRPAAGGAAQRTIGRFVRGWHINTLLCRSELYSLAHAAGFEHESTTDLTPFLETGRPRDRAIAALAALIGRISLDGSRLGPLIGGSALQRCLERGWIGYDLVVFRRRG